MATATEVFSGVYEADANHSSLEAGTRHMGVGSFRTRFEDVLARLSGSGGRLDLEGEASVESISIKNPPEFREHVVNSEDFFDAKTFPKIKFSSSQIELHDDGTLELVGSLTIKNLTREISAQGTYRPPTEDPYGGLRAAIDVSAKVDRRDFGLGWQAELPGGGNVLGWDVAIDVHLELVKV